MSACHNYMTEMQFYLLTLDSSHRLRLRVGYWSPTSECVEHSKQCQGTQKFMP